MIDQERLNIVQSLESFRHNIKGNLEYIGYKALDLIECTLIYPSYFTKQNEDIFIEVNYQLSKLVSLLRRANVPETSSFGPETSSFGLVKE